MKQAGTGEHTELVTLKPAQVMCEVREIVSRIHADCDFCLVESLYADIERLFRGEYPGYRQCNTEYHDLKHTTDTLLAMARMLHGAYLEGVRMCERSAILGLSSALLHDTGYIQTLDDAEGTGAKYTLTHISRSIEFSARYLFERGYYETDVEFCRNCLLCTGFSTKINTIGFRSDEERLAGYLLGSADLLGQMADRTYLEKLLFLFREFREGGITCYENERDLLVKTLNFHGATDHKMADEFGNVRGYMIPHFITLRRSDYDPYRAAIQRNMEYLHLVILTAGEDYRDYLRRGGVVEKLQLKTA